MASSAADDPSPPPPGGWLSGLVSGAGRILAAVLGSESSQSDASSSSQESSQSPAAADHGNGTAFASDSYQWNESGKEIVLKDSGEGSLAVTSEIETLAVTSEIDPKDAVIQLLMQETYTRSECDELIKIIQERVVDLDPGVDEADVVLPLAWVADTGTYNVSHSSLNQNASPPTTSGPCSLSHDRSLPVLKRSFYNKGDALEESRRVRPKLDGLNISEKVVDVLRSHAAAGSFENCTTVGRNASRGIPEDDIMLLSNIPLLGTENLTFSDIASKGETSDGAAWFQDKRSASTQPPLVSTSYQADWDNHGPTMFHPYPNGDRVDPVEVEPFDGIVHHEPEMINLSQKTHDTQTMRDDFGSVSKLMFQQDIEARPRVINGLAGRKQFETLHEEDQFAEDSNKDKIACQ
ncbi:hypothetical protein ACP4OV_009454 [Aristida adscensionis]